MPSHIYYRVGRYLDALEDNRAAIKVDEKYLADTNAPMGVYRLGYYPHNVHFWMASAQSAGAGQTVVAAAERIGEHIPARGAPEVVWGVAQAKGDHRTAVVQFERAAALQDALPYTEPPYWYYPIRQSLAAALLQAGRYAEAERQFQRALSRAPSNGWSYYGLAELHKARGNTTAARKAEADLARIWIGDRRLLQISNL